MNASRLHIAVMPAPGRTVRIPERDFRLLDAAGETVPRTAYWLARLRDEDVVEVPAPAEPTPEIPDAVLAAMPDDAVSVPATVSAKSRRRPATATTTET